MRKVKWVVFDRRVKRGFLFFPKTLRNRGGELETRWLETSEWVQQLNPSNVLLDYLLNFTKDRPTIWEDLYWNV